MNNNKLLSDILYQNNIQFKQLACINQVAKIIKERKSIKTTLKRIAMFIPNAMQYPESAMARVKFEGKAYWSENFYETNWILKETFEIGDWSKGAIDVFYEKGILKKEGELFLDSERELLQNISVLIIGYLSTSDKDTSEKKDNNEELIELSGKKLEYHSLFQQKGEFLKAEHSIYKSIDMICKSLPQSWEFPEFAVGRIIYNDKVF